MRIGIVNDMSLAVEALRRAIIAGRRHSVAWVAKNGVEAVAQCDLDRPDVVLMDLIMPEMDGVEATRRIVSKHGCPVLITTVNKGANAAKVFEAMGHGALDAVDTPVLGATGDAGGMVAFLEKLRTIERLTGEIPRRTAVPGAVVEEAKPRGDWLVAVGASAGGPAALATMLGALPANFPAAIVIVQHVDEQFAAGMAEWLSTKSAVPVRLAREGDTPTPGVALLAGTNDHLEFRQGGELGYTPLPRECHYRPSADVLFRSIPGNWRGGVVGVLLTGMGRDGALGLKYLRDKGHVTLAQDQASSAVYGMPKAAAELKAASEILPLDRIAARIRQLTLATIEGTPTA